MAVPRIHQEVQAEAAEREQKRLGAKAIQTEERLITLWAVIHDKMKSLRVMMEEGDTATGTDWSNFSTAAWELQRLAEMATDLSLSLGKKEPAHG